MSGAALQRGGHLGRVLDHPELRLGGDLVVETEGGHHITGPAEVLDARGNAQYACRPSTHGNGRRPNACSMLCNDRWVAGGMRRGRHGDSLADRAEQSGSAPSTEQASMPSLSPAADPGLDARRPAGEGHGRHCWVGDPPDAPGIWPGLLVEWRQREDGWHGRVAYTVAGVNGPVLVEAWLPS